MCKRWAPVVATNAIEACLTWRVTGLAPTVVITPCRRGGRPSRATVASTPCRPLMTSCHKSAAG